MKRTPILLLAGLLVFGASSALTLTARSSTQPAKMQIDDSEITTTVKAEFVKDDVVKARDIDVTTNEGVVTLTGRVATAEESARAEKLAHVNGVKSVRNLLKVGSLKG